MWVWVKTHTKSTFHAIMDYCIILQCIPYLQTEFEIHTAFLWVKRGWTVLVPRSSCSCTDYTGNVTRTVYDNFYGYKGKDPALNVFIANISQEEVAG